MGGDDDGGSNEAEWDQTRGAASTEKTEHRGCSSRDSPNRQVPSWRRAEVTPRQSAVARFQPHISHTLSHTAALRLPNARLVARCNP